MGGICDGARYASPDGGGGMMVDIARLFPRQTVEEAENGNLEPLLERLRASDLNAEESDWIERRLKGDPSAKMRAGPKQQDNRGRNLTIVYLNEWLRVRFGEPSAANRYEHLSNVREWELSPSAIKKIIKTTKAPETRWLWRALKIGDSWDEATRSNSPPDKHSPEIPELLRDVLNPSE